MKKALGIYLILMLFTTHAFAYSSAMAYAVKGDYNAKADSMNAAFIKQFMNTSKGTFYSTPFDVSGTSYNIYWQQAHAMDVLIYAYERHKDDTSKTLASKYRSYMRLWYNNHANNWDTSTPKTTGFENTFTDDMAWICLTLLHMTEATGTTMYQMTAKKVFDNTIITRAVEDSTGFWLPWNSRPETKINACTIAPCCLIAVKLYQITSEEKYLTWATKLWTYLESHLAHYDATKSDFRVEEPPLSYTQGTFGEACRRLYHITGESRYRIKAQNYFSYIFTSTRCGKNNILRNEGTSVDNSIFKAVLMPYACNFVLDEDMSITTRKAVCTYIQKNANTLWSNLNLDAYPATYCPYGWADTFDETTVASMGAMASGASLFENCARMCNELLDDPSAINSVRMEPLTNEENTAGVYTLDGRLVRTPWQNTDNLPRGIYIINRHKVYVQ